MHVILTLEVYRIAMVTDIFALDRYSQADGIDELIADYTEAVHRGGI